MLKNVNFVKSVYDKNSLINDSLPQIVLVGKSNVGKSSFINALSNNSKLAKVGANPGKTRSINYYLVNDLFYLVDLPGYGYSKMSQKEKDSTSKLVDLYLKSNNIAYIFFLVDIRHKPTSDDRTMEDYLSSFEIPFTIIANKSDKLSNKVAKENIDMIRKELFAKENIIPFSSEKKLGIDDVMSVIDNILMKNT